MGKVKVKVTRGIYVFSGKVPLLRDKSKMHFIGTKELTFRFTMPQFILLKPGLLPSFKEKSSVFLSLSYKVTSSKELSDRLRYNSNDLCDGGNPPASFGPTLTKNIY